jgi:hypothetical protein
MVVNNIVYSSLTSRTEWGNIVYFDGIGNFANPHNSLLGVEELAKTCTLALLFA